jgi:LAS superfamily LD-carboxypeptidase LdcB
MDDQQFNLLTGRQDPPLTCLGGSIYLQPPVAAAVQALQAQATKAGIDLQIASGHRSFARQLLIWNEKINGLRPLLDRQERPLNPRAYAPADLLKPLLYWSALPGTSRHHWGTDFDVFDAAVIKREDLQLTMHEAQTTLADLHHWLDEILPASKFFRPYAETQQGFAPEPWHLSFAPLAQTYQAQYTLEVFTQNLQRAPQLLLREHVLAQAAQIFTNYVQDISLPAALA